MDERTVDRTMLKVWLKKKGPTVKVATEDLARISKVSEGTINLVKSGYVPRKDSTRILLASAIGVAVDDLFPLVSAKKKKSA